MKMKNILIELNYQINERDKIKESIVNQDYYENVKIIAVYLKELEEKRKLNDILVNENS